MFEEQDAPEIRQDIDCTTCKHYIKAIVLLKKPKNIGFIHICKTTASIIKKSDVHEGACDLYVCNDDDAGNTNE